MLVSIITPTFNTGHYLEGTIKCLLEQTHPTVEHIVVDGESTDDTVDLLLRYPSVRWISEPDNGMYDAINKGLQMAQGEIVAYLNADDRYYSNTLEIVCREFEQNPKLDFLYGYCTYTTETEEPICTFRALPYISPLTRNGRITFAQPACFWRRRIHDSVGFFDSEMKNVGDADFFRRLIAQDLNGKLIRQPLATFMVRGDAVSYTLADNMSQERKAVHSRYGISRSDYRYMLNNVLYYAVNPDNYLRYLRYRLTHSRHES